MQAGLHRELDDVIGPQRLPELSDRSKLPYFNAFLTETMRIISTNPLAIPHLTMWDASLAGFFIPRDMTVIVNLWAIYHDLRNTGEIRSPFGLIVYCKDGLVYMQFYLFQPLYVRALEKSLAKKQFPLFLSRLLHRFKFECPEGEELPAEEDSDLGILRN